MLALADAAAVVAGAAALGIAEADVTPALYAAALLPVFIVVAKCCGLYDRDHVRILHRTIDELASLVRWSALSGGLAASALLLLGPDLVHGYGAVALVLGTFGAAVVARAGARALWRRLVPPENGLVIGSGPLADALARKLALEAGHHLTLARRIAFDSGNGSGPVSKVELARFSDLIERFAVERVVVAMNDLDESTLSEVVSRCRELGVKLSVAPPLHAMFGTAVELSHLAELPLIEFRTWDPSRSTMLLKRILDVSVAVVALPVIAPLFALVAVAIKLDSRGPVLFRQLRAGRHGHAFVMLKFRTMVADAPSRLLDVLDPLQLGEPAFKLRGDPRVTRVGRLLRRTSLDELPQLINVLKGEMSLVGPRPEETWLVERYEETERFRLEMPPGITGPMQVHGRAELSFRERIAVEREYVEGYSLRRDFEILLQTVAVVVRGRGAF